MSGTTLRARVLPDCSPMNSAPPWLEQEAVLAPVSAHFLHDDAELRVRDDWIQALRPGTSHPSMNEVIYSRLGDDADAVIDATIAEYVAMHTGFKWSVPAGSAPADLGERLRARGMRFWWARAMWCPTDLAVSTTEAREVTDEPVAFAELSARAWDLPIEHRSHQRRALEWAASTDRRGSGHHLMSCPPLMS